MNPTNDKVRRKKTAGFTLIELMIVVAIIGIVAAIAYPSYSQYILRSHRSEGMTFLAQAVANQERFFTNNNTYAASATILGYAAPSESENNYYSLAVDAATAGCPIATCYSMTIAAAGAQVIDTHCANMTQTSTGRKSATNTDCWQK